MPGDIKEKYLQLKQDNSQEEKRTNEIESVIVKLIYNALRFKEHDPRRLQNTSETELSDDVCHIVQIKLNDYGINISREMPRGFSKKKIGELDFYIYTFEDGIFKSISIGENKEWANFTNQLRQLLGYLTNEVKFGFTIVFNKSVLLKTILEKRKQILKDFYVEVDGLRYFETIELLDNVLGLDNVLLTAHKNPEDDTVFKVYHFVVNAYLPEREESAKQARKR
jgi:hypothetical protein